MRTNNSNVKNIIISVYYILIVFAVFFATVFSAFSYLTPNPVLTFFLLLAAFLILLFSIHAVSKYFEYDSDGIKVVVINKELLLSDHFNYREHKLEFEKHKLKAFKFSNYILYKNLSLYTKSSNGHTQKTTFNVTLVSKKKRRYIRQSLSKMIKNNLKFTD